MQEITGDQAESSEVCIANIGPKERRRRLNSGLVMLAFSSGIALATLLLGAKRPYRLLLFLLFSSSFTAIFQYFEKTWVSLGSRGLRNLDTGIEKIEDLSELKQVRRQVRKVVIKGNAASAAVTLLLFLLPVKRRH